MHIAKIHMPALHQQSDCTSALSIIRLTAAHSLKVSAAPYHLLCGHLGEEEAVLPQLCQHCYLWRVGHIHCLCSHSMRAVCLLQTSQRPQLLGEHSLDCQSLMKHACILGNNVYIYMQLHMVSTVDWHRTSELLVTFELLVTHRIVYGTLNRSAM